MNNNTERALDFIKLIGDRAVQRGNIFSGAAEVLSFINAFNHITAVMLEHEKTKATNGIKKEETETII
jgi:hypothetical protein